LASFATAHGSQTSAQMRRWSNLGHEQRITDNAGTDRDRSSGAHSHKEEEDEVNKKKTKKKKITLLRIFFTGGGSQFEGYPLPSNRLGA
jgi:hypothetical protein